MNRFSIVCCTLPIVIARASLAQGGAEEMTPEEQARAAEIMQELAQPGPQHEALVSALVGTWKTTTIFDFPGQGPTEYKGDGVARAVLGGRFILFETSTESDGQLFENLSIVGFDRRTNTYTYVGFDNVGTYYVEGEGDKDPDSGEIRFDGIVNDPVFDRKEIYYFLLRIDDEDHHTWEIWFKQHDGDEFAKFATINSVRVE